MSSSDRIDPALAADIDRLATTLAKNPRSRAFMPLAESYIKAGMWQEAAAVLEDGLSVYPGFVTAMTALGRVYDQLSQPVKAKAILEEVVKQSPDNLRAHRILAKIFAGEGNVESAMKSCAAILAVNPHDEAALSIQRHVAGGAGGTAGIKENRDLAATTPRHEPERHFGHAGADSPEGDAAPETTSMDSNASGDKTSPNAPALARLHAWLQTIQSRRQSRS